MQKGAAAARDTISIVSGSASKTTDAFKQNPAEVSVGATAAWTNDDSQPHTVTSGQTPPTLNGGFDSCKLAPAARFEHTFTDAGEYLYFFVLYPNMVGSVSVSWVFIFFSSMRMKILNIYETRKVNSSSNLLSICSSFIEPI